MDETVVAVHMIDTPDGSIQVLTGDGIHTNDENELISANDDINQLNEEMAETNQDFDIIDDPKDIKQHYDDEEEEEEDDYGEDGAEPMDANEEIDGHRVQTADADDIIIAEAVVVTQYSCKFCNRRFDSIDKVKNHYLQRHNKDQSLAQRFNTGQQSATDDNEEIEEVKTKSKVMATNARKGKSNQMNLKVVLNQPSSVWNDLKEKKRGRKPTGVKRKYPCDWPACNYVARHSVHLKDHKRTHTGEKPYRCNWPDCGHSFVQGSALKTHIRTHTGEKPYPCEWPGCTLRFSQKNNVKVHMRTHTGEKPYVCDWPGCEWRFAIKGNLDEHKRVHAGEKFFICDWPGCTRSYTQNSHLRRHRLIHTEEKPFACDWPNCSYRSVRSCDVQNHRVTHTGEKRFVCDAPDCGKAFTRAHHLRRHMITTHSAEAEDSVSYIEDNGTTEEQVIAADEIIEEEETEEQGDPIYIE